MLSALVIISSLIYLCVTAVVFVSLFRRNEFWIYFITIEYFYILGLAVAPLLIVLGLHPSPRYAFTFEQISPLVPLHIVFYSAGALAGFFTGKLSNWLSRILVEFSRGLRVRPERLFYILTGLIFFSGACYLYLTGLETAVVGAAYARVGSFDYFNGLEKFAFLKRFVVLSTFLVAFVPYFVATKKHLFFRISLIVLASCFTYLITVSRYSLMQGVIIPILLIWAVNFRKSVIINVLALLGMLFGFFVLVYGKTFLGMFGEYLFNGGEFEITKGASKAPLDAFIHLIYSIDAGIRNFWGDGTTVARDVLLSPLGVVPSSVFQYVGLSEISYQLVDPALKSSCINTAAISSREGCFLPPYFTGVSAYVAPLGGGFVFGFFRFALYAAVSKAWARLAGNEKYLPLILLALLCADQVMLFIPATISLAVFLLILIFALQQLKLLR